MTESGAPARYVRPGWFTQHAFNPTIALLTRAGLSVWGSRELRVAGEGELRVGKRIEEFRAREIADVDKAPILRAYLQRWKAEVGVFFDGVSATSPEEEVRRIAPDHPVFQIEARSPTNG